MQHVAINIRFPRTISDGIFKHSTELLDLCSAMPSVSFQHKVHSAKIEQCLQDGVVTAKKIVSRLVVLNSGGLTKRQIKIVSFDLREQIFLST